MLTPEIALAAATGALLVSLLSCLLLFSARRQMNAKLQEFKLELDVHLSANYEMARQLRNQAGRYNRAKAAPVNDEEPMQQDRVSPKAREDYRYEAPESENRPREPEVRSQQRPPPQREAGLSLAEKLGLSQSEADIVTHLRPRKRGLSETA